MNKRYFYRFDINDFGLRKYNKKGNFIALIITLLIMFIIDYLTLPAYNFQSLGFYLFLGIGFGLFSFLSLIFASYSKLLKYTVGISFLCFGIIIFGIIYTTPLLHAKQYQSQIVIKESTTFNSDFKATSLDRIPLVDKDVAAQLGEKRIGEVAALGSQYYDDKTYNLIDINNNLYRVSPLAHRSFIKWIQNYNKGVPAYIKVNVNNANDVQLVVLKEGMKYTPSGYFHQNLYRHVRFKYRTELLSDYSFELDDNNNPYWVITRYKPEIAIFSGYDAIGILVVDPFTGEIFEYDMDNLPSWVDRVQPAEFALNQLNNWGIYVHGFFNTIIGQKDMLQVTEGYNYVSIDGQTHLTTGLTSIGADRSIVGFVTINLKSKEATFYQIGGADEMSAMESAQGQVQHLNYNATFPILLNVSGQPTYFCSLKDQAGLVKMYAFIDVTNYSNVGVGEKVNEAQIAYLKKLQEAGLNNGVTDILKSIEGKIINFKSAIKDGNSFYYFNLDSSDKLYVANLSISDELAITDLGDNVKIEFIETGDNTIVVNKFDNLDYNY